MSCHISIYLLIYFALQDNNIKDIYTSISVPPWENVEALLPMRSDGARALPGVPPRVDVDMSHFLWRPPFSYTRLCYCICSGGCEEGERVCVCLGGRGYEGGGG